MGHHDCTVHPLPEVGMGIPHVTLHLMQTRGRSAAQATLEWLYRPYYGWSMYFGEPLLKATLCQPLFPTSTTAYMTPPPVFPRAVLDDTLSLDKILYNVLSQVEPAHTTTDKVDLHSASLSLSSVVGTYESTAIKLRTEQGIRMMEDIMNIKLCLLLFVVMLLSGCTVHTWSCDSDCYYPPRRAYVYTAPRYHHRHSYTPARRDHRRVARVPARPRGRCTNLNPNVCRRRDGQ